MSTSVLPHPTPLITPQTPTRTYTRRVPGAPRRLRTRHSPVINDDRRPHTRHTLGVQRRGRPGRIILTGPDFKDNQSPIRAFRRPATPHQTMRITFTPDRQRRRRQVTVLHDDTPSASSDNEDEDEDSTPSTPLRYVPTEVWTSTGPAMWTPPQHTLSSWSLDNMHELSDLSD